MKSAIRMKASLKLISILIFVILLIMIIESTYRTMKMKNQVKKTPPMPSNPLSCSDYMGQRY